MPQKMNLSSSSLDLFIPVSTPDNLTYANVYCALCHGEREFEYWNVDIKDLPSCYVKQLKDSLRSSSSLSGMTFDPHCPPIAYIDPGPHRRMRLWMKVQIKHPTPDRYSKFCFDENQMTKCSLTYVNGTIKNDTCEVPRYGICRAGASNFPCADCSLQPHQLNQCREDFDFIFFDLTFLFSVKSNFLTPTLLIHIPSSYESSIYYSLGAMGHEARLKCNSSDNNCMFPNPLLGECQIMPCPIKESCSNNSCQFPNLSTVLQSRLSSESSIATKSLLASIIALILTIILYKFIPDLQSNYAHFQLNCFFMHLASNICMFISANITSCESCCYLAALLLHFSLLSSFSWMMVTGFIIFHAFRSLNRQISSALPAPSNTGNPYKKFAYIVGHALPALFVGSCALSDSLIQPGSMGYGGNTFCWIQSHKGLFTTFIIPTSIIFSANIIIFIGCGVFLIMFHFHSGSLPTTKKRQRLVMFAMLKLVIGLGIQWLFGIILHFYPENDALRYAFIISVSVHGILILVLTMMLKVVSRHIVGLCQKVIEKVK